MRRTLPLLLLAALAAVLIGATWWYLTPEPAAQAAFAGQEVPVPSGMNVRYAETVKTQDEGTVYRFRFVAPAIAGQVAAEKAQDDMQVLCDSFARLHLPPDAPGDAMIVISLADRPVTFGDTDPDATQFFEAYRLEDGKCVWEYF